MADIIIPGTNKVLLDGTIVILSGFDDVKYILHNGFYTYNNEQFEGWYGVSIPAQVIIPLAPQMLIGCEVVYYPDSNCKCRFPSGNIPFTTEDEYQVQRSFITVDTMHDRDRLSPNMSITDMPNGRMVRVNKPNNIDYEPRYYRYRYNAELTGAYWEEFRIYEIPLDGIPKTDLSEEVQASLDKADTALQELPAYSVKWLHKEPSEQYDPYEVAKNVAVLNEILNKSINDYILYMEYRGSFYPATFWGTARRQGLYVTLYDTQVEQIVELSIYSDTNTGYSQERKLSVNTEVFDAYDSFIPATQSSTAAYIRMVADPKGAAQAVQDNLDIVSGMVSTLSSDVSQIQSNLSDINDLIPNQASAQNQLADKNFVNSSVSTNTAYFVGTFQSVEALEEYSGVITNNDYAFVVEYDPEEPTQIVAYSRYKYNERLARWEYEYTLNNSSFTAEQWAAINSGMTAQLVTSIRNHIGDTTIHVTANDKATWNSKYAKPQAGIPSTDMTAEVQASLQNADTALQEVPIASDDTLGVIKVGDNLSIDENGVVSAEAGVTPFILDWYDSEPTEEQKTESINTVLEIAQLMANEQPYSVKLRIRSGNYTIAYAELIECIKLPVVPPDFSIYKLAFAGQQVSNFGYGNLVNFDTAYTIQVFQMPNGQTWYNQYVGDFTPTATTWSKGLVQIGEGLSVTDGVISNAYELPPASANTLGGIQVGDGLSVDGNGVVSVDDNATIYFVPYTNSVSEMSPILTRMATDFENRKNVLAYIYTGYPQKVFPAILDWRYSETQSGVRSVVAIYMYAVDFKHTYTVNNYECDEIPYYYNLRGIKSNDSWIVYASQGQYAAASISDSTVTDNLPTQYKLVCQKAVVDYVNSKQYELPAATADDLGGVKVGNGLDIDENGVLSTTGGGSSMPIYIIDSQYDGSQQIPATLTTLKQVSELSPDKYLLYLRTYVNGAYRYVPCAYKYRYGYSGNYGMTLYFINYEFYSDVPSSSVGNVAHEEVLIELAQNGNTYRYVTGTSPRLNFDANSRAVPSSKGVATYIATQLSSKQDTLTPGSGIDIDSNNEISVTPGTFVEVADYTDDMSAVDTAIQSVSATASGAASAISTHASDNTIHVTVQEKTTWNNKQDTLVAGDNITINGNVISSTGGGGSDTGWQPIGLVTSGQIGALQGAWAYEAPVDSAFAYRVINGNHVYIAGGFRVISAPPVDTIISAALPDSIRPRRLVPDGSGGLNWSIGNVRFNCATATSNVNVELAIEQGGNVIRWKGMSGDTKTDMVSVMFDYYVS